MGPGSAGSMWIVNQRTSRQEAPERQDQRKYFPGGWIQGNFRNRFRATPALTKSSRPPNKTAHSSRGETSPETSPETSLETSMVAWFVWFVRWLVRPPPPHAWPPPAPAWSAKSANISPGMPPERLPRRRGRSFPPFWPPNSASYITFRLSPPSAAILVFPRGVSSLVNPGVSTTLFVQSGTQPGRCFCVRPSSSRVLFLLVLLVGGRIA